MQCRGRATLSPGPNILCERCGQHRLDAPVGLGDLVALDDVIDRRLRERVRASKNGDVGSMSELPPSGSAGCGDADMLANAL